MASALSALGARALVATEGGRMEGDVEAAGGEIIRFGAGTKNPLRLLTNSIALARLIKKHDVDLIHVRSRAPAWSALLARRLTGKPLVATYHGAYGNWGLGKNAYNGVMARADMVIANSAFTADLVRTRHAPPKDRLTTIHRGVDLEELDPEKVDGTRVARLRKAWGVNEGERVVLQAARLTGWKGQRIVIDAAARLWAGGQTGQAVFILAGDAQDRTDYVAELKTAIARNGLEGRVRLVGHCDDIAAAFKAADLAVVASTKAEAFGRAAAEAQAMGRAVIVTDLGATAETVRSEPDWPAADITGWRVPPGDAAALAQALGAALELDNATLGAIGARGRRNIVENFSLTRMQNATLAVYDRLLGTDMADEFSRGKSG